MKGVVLSGGAGTRLRPLTYSMAKQLVPVANKPILFYGLEDLAEAGISEVAIIISPQTGEEVQRVTGDGSRFGLEITYIVQDEPLGLAHALKMALPFADGDDVLMYLGDNLVKRGVKDTVADFEKDRPNGQILLTEVDNPSSFGVAELDADGSVIRLVEKPANPRSNLALVGVYLFDATINAAIDGIKPSARGELEITDAIQWMVDNGHDVRASTVLGWWKDTGRKDDLLHANELVLADQETSIDGELIDTTVRGTVVVGEGSKLIDCAVTGPAVIGAGVHLSRVTVGPFTAIADGVRCVDASLERTILLDDVEIHGWKLRDSLIGARVRLHGAAPEGFVEMTLGEQSEVIGE